MRAPSLSMSAYPHTGRSRMSTKRRAALTRGRAIAVRGTGGSTLGHGPSSEALLSERDVDRTSPLPVVC